LEPHQTGVALSKTLFNCQRTNPLAMGKTTAKRFSSTFLQMHFIMILNIIKKKIIIF